MAVIPTMTSLKGTTKRLQINKANSSMLFTTIAASFVVTFSLVASRALLSQRSYQGRVIKAKEQARDQLQENIKASESLATSYREFTETPTNVLGGSTKGQGDRDGDNGQIVLDALPSKYDYPALATSLEKLIVDQGQTLTDVSGTDEEVTQKDNQQSAKPEAVAMPITSAVEGSSDSLRDLLKVFEHSIRPIHVQTLTIASASNKITMTVKANTYYQPAKTLSIDKKVVK